MLRIHPKYIVPNAFTAMSMLFGLASVAASVEGRFELAAWMILWGVLLDKLDGTAARLLKASSEFGMQFDSFADFVVFGIAPAGLCFFRLRDLPTYEGQLSLVLLAACGLYVVAVAGRLARFNISSPPGGDRYFYGIPTTLMGAILSSLYLTWQKYHLPETVLLLWPAYLVAGAMLMVSSVRLPKLKPRKSLPLNVFQFANVAVVYATAPFMLFPEYLFGLCMLYMTVGVGSCLLSPPTDLDGGDEADADEHLVDEPALR